jgi:NAD(P)-dependent dehydrogenase (short-subunit alcohol dehydrogenase family)
MPTVLISGASRGLGLEFARQYARDGWKVLATCREPAEAGQLSALGGAVQVHALDVTDGEALAGLAGTLKGETVDVLIANAGLYGPSGSFLESPDFAGWEAVFRVNVLGTLRFCRTFIDHVAASELKTIAALSSKMGSIADNGSGGSYAYRASKAALNAAMKSLAVDLRGRGVKVAILHPGWVRTEMGGPDALIEPEESITGLRQVIAGMTAGTSGHFLDYQGREIPW